MRRPYIRFGDKFVRGVHREDGDADVYRVDVDRRNEFCDSAATAEVNATEFACLPNDVVFCKHSAEIADVLGGRVVRAGFTARARELVHGNAVVHKACVFLFEC